MMRNENRLCAAAFVSLGLFLPGVAHAQPAPLLDEDGNDRFEDATLLPAGVLAVAGEYGEGFGEFFPDTVLGLFDEFGELIAFDDDGSFFGDGTASGLAVIAGDDGTVRLKVSGFPDFDFDGLDDETGQPHQQSGDFDVLLEGVIPGDANDPSAPDVELFLFDSGFLEPGVVLDFLFEDEEIAGLELFVDIDNEIAAESRTDFRDFYRFSGLTPGVPFVAETSPIEGAFDGIDTILGLFNESGELTAVNDDFNDDDFLSQINGIVPASGEIVLAVTGFDDFDFVSPHEEFGRYVLTVTAIPEPASAALLIAALTFSPTRNR